VRGQWLITRDQTAVLDRSAALLVVFVLAGNPQGLPPAPSLRLTRVSHA